MSGAEIAFCLVAVPVVVGAIGAVRSHHLVHAALWLVLALGGLGAMYLVLGAEIVALVQILVYVGAVVVLVLFALMLTRAPMRRSDDLDVAGGRRLVAALAGVGTGVATAVLLVSTIGGRRVGIYSAAGKAEPIGAAIFTHWALPFELLSLLLLAALVGAIAIARRGDERSGDDA